MSDPCLVVVRASYSHKMDHFKTHPKNATSLGKVHTSNGAFICNVLPLLEKFPISDHFHSTSFDTRYTTYISVKLIEEQIFSVLKEKLHIKIDYQSLT